MRHTALILLVGLASVGCAHHDVEAQLRDSDVRVIDHYLDTWALLAQVPQQSDVRKLDKELRLGKPDFELRLARLLDSGDGRAAGRLVYSQVIQVGAFIDANSRLGQASLRNLGSKFPVRVMDGDHLLFAGDLYLWWQTNSNRFQPYPRLASWEASSIAVKDVIPQYKQAWSSAAVGRS